MSTYHLASLQLGTIFDEPTPRHALPITLDQTVPHGIALIDGAVRAPHRLSRLVRPSAMLGLALQRPAETVTVAVELRVDGLSTEMWHEHTLGMRASIKRKDKDQEPEIPDVSGRHRMVVLSAQGKTVAAAVLGHRPLDGEGVHQRVEFQLPPDLRGDDGLLMLGLESSTADKVWPQPGHMVDGVVGIAITRVRLDLGAAPIAPTIAVGRHDAKGALVIGETGFFPVNPGVPDEGYTLELAVRGLGGDRLRGRRARVKHPARAVKELAQDRRLDVTGEMTVEVRDLDGNQVPVEVDGSKVRVPGGVGPVLVRPEKLSPSGQQMLVDWAVRVV